MGGLFGSGKVDNSAMLAEQQRLREQREKLEAETAEKERLEAEQRRLRLSGMFGQKLLMTEDETGFDKKKKKLGEGADIYNDPNMGA